MRALKTLLAGFALLAFANLADAQTVVRITGSSAFRTATHTAIYNHPSWDASPTIAYSGTGSNFLGANNALLKGTMNGVQVIIKTTFSGSVGGLVNVTQGNNVAFIADGATTSAGTTLTGGTNSTAASANEVPDIAMSDTQQISTVFKTPILTETKVGVIPFKWITNNNRASAPTTVNLDTTSGSNTATVASATGLTVGMVISGNADVPAGARIGTITGTTITMINTNGTVANAIAGATGASTTFTSTNPLGGLTMTPSLAKALYGSGVVSLATFTGNKSDDTQYVWAIGRDADSGTRLISFAESGVGANATVFQYTTTGSPDVTSHVLAVNAGAVPAAVAALHPNAGDGGYNSGSASTGMASILKLRTPNALDIDGVVGGATGYGYYIGYAGRDDANSAITGGAQEMLWNGVTYSDEAVKQGRYTFWSFERLLYGSSVSSDTTPISGKKAIADALATRIINVDASASGIKLSDMRATRASDSGNVTQNY